MLERGWQPETPAALLLAASTARAANWVSRLDEIAEIPLPPSDAPGTLVIGEVVSLADRIAIAEQLHPALERGVLA